MGRPWLALCLALAVHVADEVSSGFLLAYGEAAEAVRKLLPFVPEPSVAVTLMLAASIGFVAVLTGLTPLAYRGVRGMRIALFWFVGLALANVVGHVGSSVLAGRWMPGVRSTPLLLAACVYAVVADRSRPSRGARRVPEHA